MMYAHALTLDPSLTKIEDELARKYLDQKLYGQALFFYNKLAAREPDNLDIQRKIAYFHYRMKDYAGAIPLYEALLQKEPEGADALNEHKILAFCADKVGKPEIAFPHYDYIIAHEPGEMKNYYLYASALVDGGKLDKAWAVSEQGLKVNANWGCLTYVKGEILEQRGLAEEKTKGYDKARDFFKQAKATFERATGDAQCGGNAVKQLDRMDAQIDRVNKMQEKEGLQ
jgi:tetratricopeptide (TPR) repeat protein